jgi:hypothetical protein
MANANARRIIDASSFYVVQDEEQPTRHYGRGTLKKIQAPDNTHSQGVLSAHNRLRETDRSAWRVMTAARGQL